MSDAEHVNAVLVGGGACANGLPDDERVRFVPASEPSVKVPCGSHYEHFERTGDAEVVEDRELRVFRWTHRTAVAE